MIDSHCHLAGEEFQADLAEVVSRARAAGVRAALVILAADDSREIARAADVVAAWPEVRFAVGVHPHKAGLFVDDPEGSAGLLAERLDGLAEARAVGEIGLDYHYDFAPRDVQQAVFRAQVRLARTRDLPIVIHTREAEDGHAAYPRGGSEPSTARRVPLLYGRRRGGGSRPGRRFPCVVRGHRLVPRATELREAAAMVPEDRLLAETDSPYLAPVPHRGQRNEPAHVARVVEVLSETRGANRDALVAAMDATFTRLFRP